MRPAIHIHWPTLASPTACRPYFLCLVSIQTHIHCIYQALKLCHCCWFLEQSAGLVFSSVSPPFRLETVLLDLLGCCIFCLTLYLV